MKRLFLIIVLFPLASWADIRYDHYRDDFPSYHYHPRQEIVIIPQLPRHRHHHHHHHHHRHARNHIRPPIFHGVQPNPHIHGHD